MSTTTIDEKYKTAIRKAESETFSIDHATETHWQAQDAYDTAMGSFLLHNPRPNELMFDCPQCGATVNKACSTPERRAQAYGSPAYYSGAHMARLHRVEIAGAVYDQEAHAVAQRAYDAVIAERRKDFLRVRAGVGR